jgi:hypothetical protein
MRVGAALSCLVPERDGVAGLGEAAVSWEVNHEALWNDLILNIV